MTTCVSFFSRRGAMLLRLALLSVLAGCALWLGFRGQFNHLKTVATANPLPELSGQAAVEHLKHEGLYDTLAEAVAAARYNADPLPSSDAYQFSNPAQDLRATFTSSGARIVSSLGGRDHELTIKLIGYGYGSRITNLDSRNIVARRNRIEHEYSLQKESAIPESQSAIKEWFVNSGAGIEHGFTLPEPPPTERGGDEALRVGMEIGGDFEPRLDAAGQAVTLACRCGGGELTYNKLRVYDAREREVAARFELEGKRLAIVVEDGEAEYPVTIDPLLAQQAKLTASDGQVIGPSVAISRDTAVVGAPGATIDGRMGQGAAYIFVRDARTTPPFWTQQAKLTARDGVEFDLFGSSVAISGDTVVIGAPREPFDIGGSGVAYIFVRNGTTWSEQQKLTAMSLETDQFGASVAIDGDTVVVGAGRADSTRGAAYVFVRDGTTWTLQQKLTASDGVTSDIFGDSVAIDGDTVVVGAPFADIAPNSAQGAAYVFVRSGTTWTQQQKLVASDGAAGDRFGESVAIDGDTVVVGAPFDDSFRGAAYVFVRSGPTWTQQQKLTASDGAANDQFGSSVAISRDTVVVGAPLADIAQNINQGAAYVFVRSGTTWTQQQKLVASDGAEFDFFGDSVATSGVTVVIGATGAAYVFAPIAPGAFMTVSAASYTFPVAPKEIVSGFGSLLAGATEAASSLPLPISLAGTSVLVIDSAGIGRDAPLYFISPSQINYQIPDGMAPGEATVLVFIETDLVAVGSVQIRSTAPSIFTLNSSGSGPAAALDAINSTLEPFNATQANGQPNIISVYGTGLGADATDVPGNVSGSVQALIGGAPVTVLYAGQAPGLVGGNQFNIQLPGVIASGAHRLTISRGGVTSNAVTIAIR